MRRTICMKNLLPQSTTALTGSTKASCLPPAELRMSLKEFFKILHVNRARMRVLPIHETVFDELRERFLERDGALLPRDRDLLMQVLHGILADVLPRPVPNHEQLRRGNNTAARLR